MTDNHHDHWEKGKNECTRHHVMPTLLLFNLNKFKRACPFPKHLTFLQSVKL